MKARAKNSRILKKAVALNITTVRPTHAQTLPLVDELNGKDWEGLIEAFKDADNLGSLITPPDFDLDKLKGQLDDLEASSSVFREYVPALRGLILQAELLRNQYWVVVANPPYMGGGSFNDVVKEFVNNNYKAGKGDLYACYILRNIEFCIDNGSFAMLTIPNWMFLSSFEDLRKFILETTFLESLVHNGRGVFGSDFGSCSFVIRKQVYRDGLGIFKRLFDKQGSVASNEELEQRFFNSINYYTKPSDFGKIPGSAIAYWISNQLINTFEEDKLNTTFNTYSQNVTGDNDRFLRFFWEIKITDVGDLKWKPYAKGGGFRKWEGNIDNLINWTSEAQNNYKKGHASQMVNQESIGKLGIAWGLVTSSSPSFRILPKSATYDKGGTSIFPISENLTFSSLTFLNSIVALNLLSLMNPTLNFQLVNIGNLPVIKENFSNAQIITLSKKLICISRQDWDNFETSWDFQIHPLLRHNTKHLSQAFTNWQNESETAFRELQRLEEENNRYWIEAYGLQDELTPEVPDDQITIRRADLNRDIRSLISYAVGCIMGRYTLDKPGLIHAGQPFDPSLHQTFPADIDAIIPITDQAYFDDDIVTRFIEFIRIAYSPETLTENLEFIANALTLRNSESTLERIRRYFLQEFISDHIQTYKKRPIYWLFTSGKKRAFSALIYLHRYNEDTLARIRTDYVLELQVKLDGEIARTQQQLENASSTVAKKAATKRLKELQDQQLELRDYQAKLQHLADARIKLDLDDGVAYNYTRFKGLVYEGADLKMADLEKASQWKRDLLKQKET
ncbi:BREX-1 system adenine-specific DNA-methyltransferase PglX [Nostoc sp. CCCryo 231-06]|nr:BREX-1 system adenine-specific DNA-methyltransferase PglX [Nostoc sp. CCCryo 231-06]